MHPPPARFRSVPHAGNRLRFSTCDAIQTRPGVPRSLKLHPSRVGPGHVKVSKRKKMNEYRHHASGFFAHRDEAESGRNTLLERGMCAREGALSAR